jgi:hypothetical protein
VFVDSRDFLAILSVSGDLVEGLPKQEVMVFQKDIFMQAQNILRSEKLLEKFDKA